VGVRKNQATLTATQKSRFVAAVKELKRSGIYDHHVHEHRSAMQSMNPDPAHLGPAFFPWHRYCLHMFERDLQAVDPSVTLPYWDWTRTRSVTSSIWNNDFMGPNGRASDLQVMSGPFAYSTGEWTLTVNDNTNTPPYLRRAFGTIATTLPTSKKVGKSLKRRPYDAAPWNWSTSTTGSFRSYSEKPLHNVVHQWVGGTMMEASSPNDPVFWMHHCMLDRLWAKWQRRNPNQPYLPSSGGPAGHNLNDPMWPWSNQADPPTPASCLDHHTFGYTYDDEANW
jgi:tyrosinase